MERLRGARQLEDIQHWLPDLNRLEDAINAASAPLAFQSKGAAQWDFIRAADYEDTWCEVKEGDQIGGVLRHGHLQQEVAPQAQRPPRRQSAAVLQRARCHVQDPLQHVG